MCGIVGYISKEKYDKNLIVTMAGMFKHRGPDGEGYFWDVMEEYNIALGHKRLAIFDLSDHGKQPMFTFDGKIGVVFNGEIYNFKEIRKQLINKGYQFRSQCDTEVILNAYCEWGINSVKKFNGMFAYSLVDLNKNIIYLVRDRMGKKPLYYLHKGKTLCWASDLSALAKFPETERTINPEVLSSYLWNQYIPAPYTIYEDVYKLESGCILTYKEGNIDICRYWDMDKLIRDRHKNIEKSLPESINVLKDLLIDSVKKRMEADVPVGVFLSGGIDSTLVASIAAKELQYNIDTFTIGFNEKEYDESVYAEKIAKHLGTNHHSQYFTPNDAKKMIDKLPYYFSEPFADNSQLPTMLLSQFTKENVTVALSGDGGDELFCGYPWYVQVQQLKEKEKISKALHGFFPHFSLYRNGNQKLWRFAKFLNAYSDKRILNLDYITSQKIITPLFGKSYSLHKEFFTLPYPKIGIMEKAQFMQMKTYLQEDIMTKVDRSSMAYSLETRAPLLDYRIVEQSICMPIEWKYADQTLKYILKKILYEYVPADLMERPKQGFGIPLSKWLHSDFNEMIGDFLSDGYIKNQGIFDSAGIRKFYSNYKNKPSVILDKIMWSILVFQLWYNVHKSF